MDFTIGSCLMIIALIEALDLSNRGQKQKKPFEILKFCEFSL